MKLTVRLFKVFKLGILMLLLLTWCDVVLLAVFLWEAIEKSSKKMLRAFYKNLKIYYTFLSKKYFRTIMANNGQK